MTDGPRTPDEVLERLMAGNERFAAGELTAVHTLAERRAELIAGQDPFAVVLTCADSRLPAAIVFDQGLGDIFVCRVAGNVLAPAILGSIEYAVTSFHCLLVMVLGHESCGAVTETIALVERDGAAPGSIQDVVAAIAPVVRSTERGSLDAAAYLDLVVSANAAAVARSIREQSTIVRQADVRVVAARYSLASGRVELVNG